MARITHISVRKRRPDYGTGIAILVILGFVVAAACGIIPAFVQ